MSLEFQELKNFSPPDNSTIEIPICIENTHTDIVDEPESIVSLIITVGNKEQNCPFFVKLIIESKVTWALDDILDEQLEYFLTKNAPALLLSYARPIVSNITGSSRFPAYDIPFIDFLHD